MSEQLDYQGYLINQRGSTESPLFFAFYAPVSEIKKWAGVRRTEEIEFGAQRILYPPRAKAITRYLLADVRNALPGCIIIGFRQDSADFSPSDNESPYNRCGEKIKKGNIQVRFEENTPEHERPGLVVDGQHRLEGCARLEGEDIPLLVVAILDSDLIEEAFQFIVINQKATKVKPTNIKSIIAEIGTIEEDLNKRLLRSGINYGKNTPFLNRLNNETDSPFYKMIDWESNSQTRDPAASRIVTVTAIESCIKRIQIDFEDYLSDSDSAESVFTTIWSTFKRLYPDLWNDDEGNKFLKKVNMVTINSMVVHDLVKAWYRNEIDPLSDDDLSEFVLKGYETIPQEFWTLDWSITVQDNSNVREAIKEDIERIQINNKLDREWKTKLKLIK